MERPGVEVLLGSMDAVHRLDPRLDGILGQSFLKGLGSYLIDYRQSRLVLEPPAPPPTGTTHWFEFRDDRPGLALKVKGTSGNREWILDSGAPEPILRAGRHPGLLATSTFDAVYINNREQFVVLKPKSARP